MSLEVLLDDFHHSVDGSDLATSHLLQVLERLKDLVRDLEARNEAHKETSRNFMTELIHIKEQQLHEHERIMRLEARLAIVEGRKPIVALDVPIQDPSSKSYSITRPALKRWRWDPIKRKKVEEERKSDTGHIPTWDLVKEDP